MLYKLRPRFIPAYLPFLLIIAKFVVTAVIGVYGPRYPHKFTANMKSLNDKALNTTAAAGKDNIGEDIFSELRQGGPGSIATCFLEEAVVVEALGP